MDRLITVAAELQEFCSKRRWKFCFIGGIAVQEWSEPRMTDDVDLTLLTGFGGEEAFIDELLRHYPSRRADAREFALINRVLVLQNDSGIGIDIALGALPFEELAITRAKQIKYAPGVTLTICSPEDLIVMKAFASRDRDWRDVQMTIIRQGAGALDWPYIFNQLEPLAALKEHPEILERLRELKKKTNPAP